MSGTFFRNSTPECPKISEKPDPCFGGKGQFYHKISLAVPTLQRQKLGRLRIDQAQKSFPDPIQLISGVTAGGRQRGQEPRTVWGARRQRIGWTTNSLRAMPTLNSPSLRQITASPPSPNKLDREGIGWLKRALRSIISLQIWLNPDPQRKEGESNNLELSVFAEGSAEEFDSEAFELLKKLHECIDFSDPEARISQSCELHFCRYAPSIITRGEIEVLGISMPRFAIRVYLEKHFSDDDKRGVPFVNIRRLHELRPQVTWAPRIAQLQNQLKNFTEPAKNIAETDPPSPGALIAKALHFADSLLKFTDNENGWHVLTAPLGRHYGEKEIDGTPYVQTYQFSGLCAQAVCFIANALMLKYARGLFGIAEITKIAQQLPGTIETPGSEVEEIALQGLNCEQIEKYFSANEVGLRAPMQLLHPLLRSSTSSLHGLMERSWFASSIRSYLLSDFPVIVPVDLNQLNSPTGAYNHPGNRLHVPPGIRNELLGVDISVHADGDPSYHALCLVGCSKESSKRLFLAHDPTFMPFVQISEDELFESLAPPPTVEDVDGYSCFLPVVPEKVLLLLDSEILGDTPRMGLRNIIDSMRLRAESSAPSAYRGPRGELPLCGSNTTPGEFRLVEISDSVRLRQKLEDVKVEKKWIERACEWLAEREARSVMLGSGGSMWAWLHFDRDYLYVWNAELVPNSSSDFISILRFACGNSRSLDRIEPVHWKSAVGIRRTPIPLEPVEFPRSRNDSDEIELEACLITSFAMTGISRCLQENWPTEIDNAELYAFMQCDAEELLARHSNLGFGRSASAHMSAIFHSERADRSLRIAAVADEIAERFKDGPRIRAIASFLPEISVWDDKQRAFIPSAQTIASIKFLMHLGRVLRDKHHHNVGVIELVCGSRTTGVYYGRNADVKNLDGLLLNVPAESKLVAALVEMLNSIVRDAGECDMRIALEMEPGPLHLMNSPAVVSRVLELTDPTRIGANIDIAHYAFLARETAQNVLQRWGLDGRVFHAHISGHSIGHLGDVGLDDLGQASKHLFDPWIDGLGWLRNQYRSFGSTYSGLVSLELECVRCAQQCIKGSAGLLARMLTRRP